MYVCPCFKFVKLGLTRFKQREKGKGIEFCCGKPMMTTAVIFYRSNYYYCVLLLLLLSIIWPKHNGVALLINTYGQWNAQCMRSREKKGVFCRQWSAGVHFSSCCRRTTDNREL